MRKQADTASSSEHAPLVVSSFANEEESVTTPASLLVSYRRLSLCSLATSLVSIFATTIILIVILYYAIASSVYSNYGLLSLIVDPCFIAPVTCHDQDKYNSGDNQANLIPKRVLVVAAHPDDIEASCGGTIAKWAHKHGTQVTFVLMTNGDHGAVNKSLTPAEITVIRQAEQVRQNLL